MKTPDISIITINYNGMPDTMEMVNSIPSCALDIEVIVVDNGSKEGEAEKLQKALPVGVKLIRSDKNLGFAGGNNLGIDAARGKYLFFVNNDTLFEDFDFVKLIETFDRDDKIGAVCPKIRFSWGERLIQYAGYTKLNPITVRNKAFGCGEKDNGQWDTPIETPYMHGAAVMVRKEVIEKAGKMPECYFLYYEELDWSMMIRKAGFTIWTCPKCQIFHKESRTTGQASPLRTYYLTRNRILFVKRNAPASTKWLALAYLYLLVAPRDIIKAIIKGKKDILKAILKAL